MVLVVGDTREEAARDLAAFFHVPYKTPKPKPPVPAKPPDPPPPPEPPVRWEPVCVIDQIRPVQVVVQFNCLACGRTAAHSGRCSVCGGCVLLEAV